MQMSRDILCVFMVKATKCAQNNSNSHPAQRQKSVCCAKSAELSELSLMSVAVLLLGLADVRTHHCRLVLLNCRRRSRTKRTGGSLKILRDAAKILGSTLLLMRRRQCAFTLEYVIHLFLDLPF